jgi:hypothetical protein
MMLDSNAQTKVPARTSPNRTRASENLRLKANNRSFRRKGDMKLRQLLLRLETRPACSQLQSLTPRVKFLRHPKFQSP